MQDELITLYTKENPDEPVKCSRKEYYDHDFSTYRDHYPALVDVFLFNRFGDLLLQRRGRDKRKNPYKLHTTVGGHINWGEKPEFSLVHECMEELGVAAVLVPEADYKEAITKLESYSHKAALVYKVKDYYRNFSESKIENRRGIKDRIWLYFGFYDGPIETPDRQSAGYEWINLETLAAELRANPDQFTSGLAAYVEELGGHFESFTQLLSSYTEKNKKAVESRAVESQVSV